MLTRHSEPGRAGRVRQLVCRLVAPQWPLTESAHSLARLGPARLAQPGPESAGRLGRPAGAGTILQDVSPAPGGPLGRLPLRPGTYRCNEAAVFLLIGWLAVTVAVLLLMGWFAVTVAVFLLMGWFAVTVAVFLLMGGLL